MHLQEELLRVIYGENLYVTAAVVFLGTLALLWLKSWWDMRNAVPLDVSAACGDITPEELAKHDGRDPFKPIYFSVQGRVFDVTAGRDFYGPEGGYAIFAGKEVARALAVMSLKAEDCTADLEGVTPKQLDTLGEWVAKFEKKYRVVGKVVEPQRLTLEELATFNGAEAGKPIYLAIRGVVFNVTSGKDFYGPEGVYPFAGHECARAFALLSTDTADCHDNLEGLGAMELDNLRDWEAKFRYKYPIVGSVVPAKA